VRTRTVKFAMAVPAGFRATQRNVPFSSDVAFKMRSSLFFSTGVEAKEGVEMESGTLFAELGGRRGWEERSDPTGYAPEVSTSKLREALDNGWPLKSHSREDSGTEETLHRRDTFFPSPVGKTQSDFQSFNTLYVN